MPGVPVYFNGLRYIYEGYRFVIVALTPGLYVSIAGVGLVLAIFHVRGPLGIFRSYPSTYIVIRRIRSVLLNPTRVEYTSKYVKN